MPNWATAAVFVVLLFAFVAGVNVLDVWFSGWYALGKTYPRPRHLKPHQQHRAVPGKVGRFASNHVFIVGADGGGLYLSYVAPLRWLAPALYIPWSALRFERCWKFLWIRKIRYRTATGTPIELHGRAADLVEQYAPPP